MKGILEYSYCLTLNKQEILKIFYQDLNKKSQDILDYASWDSFLSNTVDESLQILENKVYLSLNDSTKNFMSPNHSPYPENPNKSSFNSYGDNPWNEIPNPNLSDPWLENRNLQSQPNHDPWGENHEPYPEDS